MAINGDLEQGSQIEKRSAEETGTRTQGSGPKPSDSTLRDDWKEHLGEDYSIEVLELDPDSLSWESVRGLSLSKDLLTPSSGAKARLCLIEGLSKDVVSLFSEVSSDFKDFFHRHCLNALPYDCSRLDCQHFYGKWTRQARQTPEQWIADDRIKRHRPWARNVPIDPKKVNSDHVRYKMPPSVRRPRGSLEAHVGDKFKKDGHLLEKSRRSYYQGMIKQEEASHLRKEKKKYTVRCAVQECISTYYPELEDKAFVGLLLFDAPAEITVKYKTYSTTKPPPEPSLEPCFEGFESSWTRFKQQLELDENSKRFLERPAACIRDIILRLMLDDQVQIMGDFREALDFIDENMSDNDMLRNNLDDWRSLFGQCKKILSNDISALAYTTEALGPPIYPKSDQIGAMRSSMSRLQRTDSTFRPPVQADFDRLRLETKDLTERAVLTFQAMTATMSMVESQKSIAQAETISKLTELAFFFIPLTLTSSIFGMNIPEWNNKLNTWIWVAVSLLVLLLTYMVLYHEELTAALSNKKLDQPRVTDAAKDVSKAKQVAELYLKRLILFLRSMLKFIIWLSIIAGWAVGIWTLVTKVPLETSAKASVAVGFALGVPSIITVLATAIINESHAYHNRRRTRNGIICAISLSLIIGVIMTTWAVMEYIPLSYSQRVNIAVAVAIGIPFHGIKASTYLQCGIAWWSLLINAVIFLATMAPVLWAINTKTRLDRDAEVAISVALVCGLPCFIPVVGYAPQVSKETKKWIVTGWALHFSGILERKRKWAVSEGQK